MVQNPLSNAIIERLARGELSAAVELDRHGIIPGAEETPQQMAERLRTLQANLAKMESELQDNGCYRLEDLTVEANARIPDGILAETADRTERLFRFSNDWVPGFFLNPSCSLLFGGCAFYYYPDFFALFIIRADFKQKKRWLLYQRQELLSHELCHVARIALLSSLFEETFAYQTATTAFRRWLGGIFRSPKDSFLFLGAALCQLLGQLLQTFLFPALPVWPFWLLFLAVFIFLFLRHCHYTGILHQARRTLAWNFPHEHLLPVLFRCTDPEILELARMHSPAELQQFLQQRQNCLRWQLINQRFSAERLTPQPPQTVSP